MTNRDNVMSEGGAASKVAVAALLRRIPVFASLEDEHVEQTECPGREARSG